MIINWNNLYFTPNSYLIIARKKIKKIFNYFSS